MTADLGAVRDLIEAGLNEPADAAATYGISAVALDLGRRWFSASCRCSWHWRAILQWIPALQSGTMLVATSRPRGVTASGYSSTIPLIGCEAATLPGLILSSRFLLMTHQATIERAALASAVVPRLFAGCLRSRGRLSDRSVGAERRGGRRQRARRTHPRSLAGAAGFWRAVPGDTRWRGSRNGGCGGSRRGGCG